jgi:hypothetical protein
MAEPRPTEPTQQTWTFIVLFRLPGDGVLDLTNRGILELLEIVLNTIQNTDHDEIVILEGDAPIPQGHFAVPVGIITYERMEQELSQLTRELCLENAFMTAYQWRTRYRRHIIHLVRSRRAQRG